MPSIIHSFLLALNAAAFIALSDFPRTTSFALASPLSMSLPVTRPVDHPSGTLDTATLTMSSQRDATSVSHPIVYSRIERLEHRKTSDQFSALQKYYHKANANAGNLSKYNHASSRHLAEGLHIMTEELAARSSTEEGNDPQFQQDCASQLAEFNTNVRGFQSTLGELSSGKGLAFYDSNNDLETLLKNIVNANKSALGAVSKIVDNIPILGPILGPCKC